MDQNRRAIAIARKRLDALGVDAVEERLIEPDEAPSEIEPAADSLRDLSEAG